MSADARRLCRLLRPAGGGLYVVSTGVAEQRALQRKIYGADTDDGIDACWRDAIDGISRARVVVLGVPSDVGAGFTRGANRAPSALRGFLMSRPKHPIWSEDVVDVGDVFCVPQLLSDDMLSTAQLAATREALYGTQETDLPVAPLDICRAALDAVHALNPDAVTVVIGGDHSVGYPAFAACYDHWTARGRRVGLLHFDAHTDLLAERLGVRICFATWAWHANQLMGNDGRIVQVGIRISGRERGHWETDQNLRQIWAHEANAMGVDALVDEITARFTALGVDALYVSNDIDGTDPAFAAATGTPEPDGLEPPLVTALTRRLAARFPLIGGDLVEVAPPLANEVPGEPEQTLQTASTYLADLIAPI